MHAHFVIAYDPIEIISNEAFDDRSRADMAYLATDLHHRDHDGVEVVMLSYGSDPESNSLIRTLRHRKGHDVPRWLDALTGLVRTLPRASHPAQVTEALLGG